MTSQTEQPKKSISWVLNLNLIAILFLMVYPLTTISDSEFKGSDVAISEFDSGWTTNWWVFPSSKFESLLFALGAAAGGIFVGYFLASCEAVEKGEKKMKVHPKTQTEINPFLKTSVERGGHSYYVEK